MSMYNITIIGAGIVGLSTALKLTEKYPSLKILILEKENDICRHQTGNNSGVIHSGIYYKPGSLKALNCRKGYKMLLEYCNKNGIQYDICGKVIVAIENDQIPVLDNLYNRGIENGLDGLKKITKDEINEIEPYVNGVAGVFVPQTGITNYLDVSGKYLEDILKHDARLRLNEKVISIKKFTDYHEVVTPKGSYQTKVVISCTGLQSDRIARLTNPDADFKIIPFRGEYYKVKPDKEYLVKSLVYPVPDPAFPFLGVHFTRMIKGSVEAGPNAVLSFKREGYSKTSFNLHDTIETFAWGGFRKVMMKYWKTGFGEFYRSYNKSAFTSALQKLIPSIQKEDLIKGGAGIRAQACDKAGRLIDDFYFIESKNILHVCNAPSPAATASLAIGDFIADKILKDYK
jgi:(S)-2-hydroxyglutarate dehydrogenase